MSLTLGNEFEFDQRLQLPHNFVYCGGSGSGKTTLLMGTLENATRMYNPVPKKIVFLFTCFQEAYQTLKQKLEEQNIECSFLKATNLQEEDLDSIRDKNGGQTLIVIDDNSISAANSPSIAQICTTARHKNCSIVLLFHFVFGPWPPLRIIMANCGYIFFLKSPRILNQIANLASQIGLRKAVVAAYQAETKQSYGHVLLDLCTTTNDQLRIRANILSPQQTIYVPSH